MRQRWDLHQNWYFTTENVSAEMPEQMPEVMPEIWESVSVPHSFRLEPYAHKGVCTAQGIGCYCRYFSWRDSWKNKGLYLTFEAVMGVTEVWLNGNLLHTNYGGYLPFVVCLNDWIYSDGRENILFVRTDNRDNEQVPPGKPQELLDFTYFGGIYRDVFLEEVEEIFITDPLYEDKENGGGILIEYPQVTSQRAVVSVKTHIRSFREEEQRSVLIWEIIDMDGSRKVHKVKESMVPGKGSVEIVEEFEIETPFLWSPSSPYLYRLVESVCVGGVLIDQKTVRIGIRQIETDRERGILINGQVQPLLSGVNRHQDYPVIGNAAPASMQKRDALLLKQAGFSVVRAAHYPMSEAFLDACDELGILVFEATPGWQWFPVGEPEPFSARVRQNIRQMVRRDRNHPCILAYEVVLNETYHVPDGFTRKSALTALAEQPSAKIATESYGYDASPERNGIDREAHFIFGFEQPLEKTEKAVMFLREYSDCWIEAYGQFASRRVTRGQTDGFYPQGEARNLKKANQMLWQHLEGEYSLAKCHALRRDEPAFTGCAIWTGIDSRGAKSEIGPCGILNAYRLPKISYWAFASQQEDRTILYLATEWTKEAPVLDKARGEKPFGTDSSREIFVYSNAEKVMLTVERKDEILWKETHTPYREGDAAYLPHPPFRFTGVPYAEGTTLCAYGYDRSGRLIAEDRRQTAGKPYRIRMRTEDMGIPLLADGNDMLLIHAEIVDENGTLCTDAMHRVYFEVEGDVKIVGNHNLLADTNPARAEAGIASVYLQAGKKAGKASITACAAGLCGDRIEIFLAEPELLELPGRILDNGEKDWPAAGNLSAHGMCGEAENVFMAESEKERYPDSIRLTGTAVWKLQDETYLEMSCGALADDGQAELLIYLDDVLRRKEKVGRIKKMTVLVTGASELRMEIRGSEPAGVMLYSPYLWKGIVQDTDASFQDNIAFGKPALATENSGDAANVWGKGGWLGGRPEEGLQEWQVDLGSPCDVRNARVYVGGQMGADSTPYRYEIHTSENGKEWIRQTENERTAWSNGVLDYFTASNVRYVKVVFTKVDGGLAAGIQEFELYRDQGVDSASEYALSGIVIEEEDVIFSPERLVYRLAPQKQLTIRAMAYDPEAKVTVCKRGMPYPCDGRIRSVDPVTVSQEECGGKAVIQVTAASGNAMREYILDFTKKNQEEERQDEEQD